MPWNARRSLGGNTTISEADTSRTSTTSTTRSAIRKRKLRLLCRSKNWMAVLQRATEKPAGTVFIFSFAEAELHNGRRVGAYGVPHHLINDVDFGFLEGIPENRREGMDRTLTHNTHLCSTGFSQARTAHTTRLALELHCHLGAPDKNVVIWCFPCLILGCLTCPSPRALQLPHSLFFLGHKKNAAQSVQPEQLREHPVHHAHSLSRQVAPSRITLARRPAEWRKPAHNNSHNLQRYVRIQDFCWSQGKTTDQSFRETWCRNKIFLVPWHGRSREVMCGKMSRTCEWHDPTIKQSRNSMHGWPLILRRKWVSRRRVYSVLKKMFWNVCIWFVLRDPIFFWSVNKLARTVIKFSKSCDERLARLISYIHRTCEYWQHCYVENTAMQTRIVSRLWFCRRRLKKTTLGGIFCAFRKSHVCAKKLDVQETDFSFTQCYKSRNHFSRCRFTHGRYSRSHSSGSGDWSVSFRTEQNRWTQERSQTPTSFQQTLITFHQMQRILIPELFCLSMTTMRHESRWLSNGEVPQCGMFHGPTKLQCIDFLKGLIRIQNQIRYIVTKHQLADMLTEGNFTAISVPLAAPRISLWWAAPHWRRGYKIKKKKKRLCPILELQRWILLLFLRQVPPPHRVRLHRKVGRWR